MWRLHKGSGAGEWADTVRLLRASDPATKLILSGLATDDDRAEHMRMLMCML